MRIIRGIGNFLYEERLKGLRICLTEKMYKMEHDQSLYKEWLRNNHWGFFLRVKAFLNFLENEKRRILT